MRYFVLCIFLLCAVCSGQEVTTRPKRQSVVLYERNLTVQERERFLLDDSDSRDIEAAESIESIKKSLDFQDLEKQKDLVKIEVVTILNNPGKQYLCTTRLGTDNLQVKHAQAIREKVEKEFVIDKDIGDYTHKAPFIPRGHISDRRWTLDNPYICELYEKFEHKSNSGIFLARLYYSPDREISIHNLLAYVICGNPVVVATPNGPMVKAQRVPSFLTEKEKAEKNRWPKHTPDNTDYVMAWLAGEHIAIYLIGTEEQLKQFLPIYGAKYPSTLPGDLKIDRTAWTQAEVNEWLQTLTQLLDDPAVSQKDKIQQAKICMNKILDVVYIPGLREMVRYDMTLDICRAWQKQAAAWWLVNQNQLTIEPWWLTSPDRVGMVATPWQQMVVKGQTPADYKKRLEDDKKNAREKFFNTPIPPEDVERLRKEFVASLETLLHHDWADTIKESVPEETVLTQNKDGSYTMKYALPRPLPNGKGTFIQRLDITYSPPTLELTKIRERPLQMRSLRTIHRWDVVKDGREEHDEDVQTYDYYKEDGKWLVGKVLQVKK